MSSEKFQMLAKTFSGLEEVLKEELVAIGASDVEVVVRGVKFTGSKEVLYKANFCCRTALKILRMIGEYKVHNTNDLYQSVYKIDWSEIFDLSQSFSINSTVNSEAFNNSMFVSLKAKDAIVDQFRSKFKKRPSVNPDNPDIRINVHASADSLTVSLDSSGESLHKRGYRFGQNEASMSEVLAAGILKIIGWDGQCDFYDTMCGSGTIPVEAALIARNIPPGMFRKEFAFERWKDFDAELFEKIYNDDYERPFDHKIYASDLVSMSMMVTEKNAKNAGVFKDIEMNTIDFAQFEPKSKEGLLLINPPYGERMRDRMLEPLYTMIGDQLKKSFSGFKAWVFSSSEEGFKNIGLRPSQKIPLVNGSLECSLRLFELYDGSKKAKKQTDGQYQSKSYGDRRQHSGDNRQRSEFAPRENRDYKRRDNDSFKSRDNSGFKPRNNDGFKPRDNKDFKPRGNNDFKPRERYGDKLASTGENNQEQIYERTPREVSEFTKTRDWSKFVPRHKLESKPTREEGDKNYNRPQKAQSQKDENKKYRKRI